MSQHDYNIANQPGAAVRADINAVLDAIASQNAGAAQPSITFPNMLWYDSTATQLKQRNPANNAWIVLATITGSTYKISETLLNLPASGSWFGTNNRFPYIDTGGVMEVGKTIDFHPDATGTEDYQLRITRDAGANGLAAILQTGTAGLNIQPGSGGLFISNVKLGQLPIGAFVDYGGTSAPSGFIFAAGQNVSRTTYANLFAVYGTTYGSGDGSTTFGVPDKRGRVTAGKDDMGGVSANRLTGLSGGVNGDVLGATGGVEAHTLTTAELAAHGHTFTTGTESQSHTHTSSAGQRNGFNPSVVSVPHFSNDDNTVSGQTVNLVSGNASQTHTHSGTTANNGSGSAHNNVQPTFIANVLIWTGI